MTLHPFYVWTRNGVLLRVLATDERTAAAVVNREGTHGVVMHTETEAEYRRRNHEAERLLCRHCGDPKVICGGWCRLPAYSQH